MSAHVSLLKEDKDRIETSLDRLGRQMDKYWDEPDAVADMEYEQHRLERDLVKVRTQLAVGTKVNTLHRQKDCLGYNPGV